MDIESMDYSILEFIQSNIKSPFLDKVMVLFTRMGDLSSIWIVTAILFLFSKKNYKYGAGIIIALILSGIIGNLILKNIFGRVRPFDVYDGITLLISRPMDYSFPSGHTMSSIAAATVIFSADYRLGIISWVIALLIAFSRMYLFVHYPTDIAAGMLIGVLIGVISICIINTSFMSKIMSLAGLPL